MTQITAPSEFGDRLRSANDLVEVCDEHGVVLGTFCPAVDKSLYEDLEPPLSLEELRRRASEPGGRPLPEILEDLRRRA